MARFVVENGHQKTCVVMRFQYLKPLVGSEYDLVCDHVKRRRISTLNPYNSCISTPIQEFEMKIFVILKC